MEIETKKKQMIRSNAAQIKYLVGYMSQHRAFAAGQFRGPLGSAGHEAEWRRLKSALDEIGPARSVEQWKLCWRDQKKKARAEGGKMKKTREQTGNNAIVPDLSENSEIVLGTIGHAMAVGIGPAESPIGYSEAQASCSSSTPVISASSCSLPLPPVEFADLSALSPSRDSPPAPARRAVQPQKNAGGRSRVRRENPPDRFLKAQHENNELLKELIHKIDESNRLKSEQVQLMREANALQEKLLLLHNK